MKQIFSATGDDGYSGLLGDDRVPKYHPRLEAVGALDEANASLGIARSSSQASDTRLILLSVQRDLYFIMAEVSAKIENAHHFREIDDAKVEWLEDQISIISNEVQIPSEFIIPGDTQAGAALALSRTIVRRAERRLAKLWVENEIENQNLLRYLNRLSSLCFILELYENKISGNEYSTQAKEDQK